MKLFKKLFNKESIPSTSQKIYISHPYQNKAANIQDIEKIVKKFVNYDKDNIYISPVHCFGYLYDYVDYETGIKYCLELLKTCDKMWVFGDYKNSKGCNIEIDYCKKHGIPYRICGERANNNGCN